MSYKQQQNSHDGNVDQLLEGKRGDFRESHVTEPPARIIEVVVCSKKNKQKKQV